MNIKRFGGILLFAFITILPEAYGIESPCPKALVNDCMEQIDDFRDCLIDTIDQLYPHLTYWKHHCHTLTTATTSQQESAATHIGALEQEIARNAHFLGYFNDVASQCKDISDQTKLQAHIYKTATLMDTCLTFCPQDMQEEESTAPIDQEMIHTMLMSTKDKIEHYTKTVLERTKLHHKPSHFARHWLGYTFGTLCTLGALAYMHKNKEALTTWIRATHESAKRFFANYAYKPIKNAINIFYGKNQPESIKLSEESIQRMIIDYYREIHPHMLYDEMKQKAQGAAQNRELPAELIEELALEMRNFRTNLWLPNWKITQYFGRGQYIRINAIEFEIFKLQLIDMFQANRLTIELLLTIPTFALLYGSYKISKNISHKISPHHISYKPIKRGLLKVEHILNNHNNTAVQMSYSAQGQLYYWLCKLRNYADQVPDKKRLYFLEDLAELGASDLQVDQKLSTINRMYRTYSFLLRTRGKQ